jgi:hypothetical protein
MRSSFAIDFESFGGRIWFNCSHQGPLPRLAILAAERAIRQKPNPYLIEDNDFITVPRMLKSSLAPVIGASPEGHHFGKQRLLVPSELRRIACNYGENTKTATKGSLAFVLRRAPILIIVCSY